MVLLQEFLQYALLMYDSICVAILSWLIKMMPAFNPWDPMLTLIPCSYQWDPQEK
jgi:hypothetical protein